MLSEKEILDVLKNIVDPDLNKDIVSLGFVKNLKIGEKSVSLTINLTTPACPLKSQFKQDAINLIKSNFKEIEKVDVEITSEVKKGARQEGFLDVFPEAKNIVAVGSGKGGVGKSTVAVNIASALSVLGSKVGLLDADIYGPSISMMLKTDLKPILMGDKILPLKSNNIFYISMGFLIEEETPIIWRGPLVSRAIEQLLSEVQWPELDYLIIDLPPGTGDAQLTICQRVPVTGAIIVSTPNDVALKTAKRGLVMFEKMNVPILGVVENMSYFVCPYCNNHSDIFVSGLVEEEGQKLGIPCLSKIPVEPKVAESGEKGIPIVNLYPSSETSKAFIKCAEKLASEISKLNLKEK